MQDLEELLSTYLHQDWGYVHDSWQDAVDAFVREQPDRAARVPAEIDALLAQDMSSEQLAQAVLSLGAAYDPTASGQTDAEWLTDVKQQLRATLAARGE